MAGDTPLAGFPVSGRQVVEHLDEMVGLETLPQNFLVIPIREEELDTSKAGTGRRRETLQKLYFAEQRGEVGRESEHLRFFPEWSVVEDIAPWPGSQQARRESIGSDIKLNGSACCYPDSPRSSRSASTWRMAPYSSSEIGSIAVRL
jgi:hypothetical protein